MLSLVKAQQTAALAGWVVLFGTSRTVYQYFHLHWQLKAFGIRLVMVR